MIIFYLLSKGMALVICFITIGKAKDMIAEISVDYGVDPGNATAISSLNDQVKTLNAAYGFDMTLLVLMAGNFILNGCTMTRPLRTMAPKHKDEVEV